MASGKRYQHRTWCVRHTARLTAVPVLRAMRVVDASPLSAMRAGAHAADPSAAGYTKRVRGAAEEPPAAAAGNGGNGEDGAGASKRARLVWTPQLHSRFVDAVTHLGIKAAVPKTIMQARNTHGAFRLRQSYPRYCIGRHTSLESTQR
jgi:SHAQKYF class myb-like DNA-binding protein